MTNGRHILAALSLAAILAGLPHSGAAQAGRGQSADAPVGWGANTVTYRPDGVTLEGAAELTQGENRMRANRVSLNTDGSGALTRVEAAGEVYYVTPNETMRGDSAVYTPSNDTAVVTGDVILTQGQNVMTGRHLTYNLRTEQAVMNGGSGGRVRGVFYPQRSGQ